ncbi:unnamed protein product, partial [Iphiclides podalirius]
MTSVARRREHDDSGEFSDASQDIERSSSANDGGPNESDYDSAGSESEHSDRDPESQDNEAEAERRVDDDEDRSNPQYIPKKGTFYEHDDRTAASGEESVNTTSDVASEKKDGSETPSERRRPPRKSETVNRWSHDKYNENEQMPKSRDELVAIYGYDIRNEDAPPHARRNRRYGRGPNKYTRTWEDEEAYRRQAAAAPHRRPPNPEEFPELDAHRKLGKKSRAPRPRSKSQPASNDSSERGYQMRRGGELRASAKNTGTNTSTKPKPVAKPVAKQNAAPKPAAKPPAKDKLPQLEISPSPPTSPAIAPLYSRRYMAFLFFSCYCYCSTCSEVSGQPQRRVSAAVAQQRPVPTEQAKKKPPAQTPQQGSALTTKPSGQQQQAQQQQKPQQQQNQQQQQTGAEAKSGGSKRYSSLRQRPLAETYSPQQPQQQPQQPQPPTQQQQQQQQQQQPPQPQQPQQQTQPQQSQQQTQQQPQHRYHGEYPGNAPSQPQHQGSPVPQIHPQQLIHQQVHRSGGAAQHGPSPPHQHQSLPQQHSQQVRLGMMEQPPQMVSHPHHSMHNIPPQHPIGQLQPTQGYAPPAMMPAQYMQQSGSGAVFGGAPMYAQAPAAYPHQMYQHHNYATQAGGVTYYNCAEQEPPPPQPRAQRRPTAAIPIVRPAQPAHNSERPANSTEKDNIDRIVENMFVRKPWPAQGADASKEKSQESRTSQEPQSKESSQPNSLTSSSISTDSKPADSGQKETEESRVGKETQESETVAPQESIPTEA